MPKKIYQPEVIANANEIIDILSENMFFEDYEITDLDFVRDYLCDKLTDKFINGMLDGEADNMFGEDEFQKILNEIVAGSILYELKKKGFVNSYEDENTEEMFFLTEKGKKVLNEKDRFN